MNEPKGCTKDESLSWCMGSLGILYSVLFPVKYFQFGSFIIKPLISRVRGLFF